jgi:hypothetical protein
VATGLPLRHALFSKTGVRWKGLNGHAANGRTPCSATIGTLLWPTVGVRFALAVPVITGISQAAELHSAFLALATPATALPGDPQRLIEQTIQETVDLGLKRRLQAIATKLAEVTRARKEYEARAIQSSIRSGAILVRDIRDMDARIRAIGKYRDAARSEVNNGFKDAGRQVQEYTASADRVEARQRISLDTYAHLVVQIGEDYPEDAVQTQLQIVTNEFEAQNLMTLPPFAQLFMRHMQLYRASKLLAPQSWLQRSCTRGRS